MKSFYFLISFLLFSSCNLLQESEFSMGQNGEEEIVKQVNDQFLGANRSDSLSGLEDPLIKLCGDLPASMADLTGGIKKYFYRFTSESNVNLDALGYGHGEIGKNEVLVIIDFVQHKTINCSDNLRSFGVGARLFLKITKSKRKLSLGLPKLAANVELGKAEVEYTLSTIGITGDKVLELLPTGNDFDVENYAKIVNSIDEIIKLCKDNVDGVIIEPQLLPVLK